MKLKELNEAFEVVTKVYDSVENFQRKLELSKPYREMKQNMEFIEDERQKILKKYSDKDGKLIPENGNKANLEFNELLNAETKMKTFIKFTTEELENSKIKGSELSVIINDFVKT